MTTSMKIVIAAAILVVPAGAGVRAWVVSELERKARARRDVLAREEARIVQERQRIEQEKAQAARREEETKLKKIVDGLDDLVSQCKSPLGALGVPRRGQAVIWNYRQRERSPAQDQLPPTLREKSPDDKLALFLVLDKKDHAVATYTRGLAFGKGRNVPNLTAITGYQAKLEVCVFFWPEKKMMGRAFVRGDMPPLSLNRTQWDNSPVHGPWESALARWVESYLRGEPIPNPLENDRLFGRP